MPRKPHCVIVLLETSLCSNNKHQLAITPVQSESFSYAVSNLASLQTLWQSKPSKYDCIFPWRLCCRLRVWDKLNANISKGTREWLVLLKGTLYRSVENLHLSRIEDSDLTSLRPDLLLAFPSSNSQWLYWEFLIHIYFDSSNRNLTGSIFQVSISER